MSVCLSPAPSNQDESAKAKGKKTPTSTAKVRKRRGFFERSGVKVSAHRLGSVAYVLTGCFLGVWGSRRLFSDRFPGWRSPAPSASSARSTARTWPHILKASFTRTTSSFCPISCQSPPPTSCRCGRFTYKRTKLSSTCCPDGCVLCVL